MSTPESTLQARVADLKAVVKSGTRKERKKNALKRGISISVKRTEGPVRLPRLPGSGKQK